MVYSNQSIDVVGETVEVAKVMRCRHYEDDGDRR
jgi:hypothetical protein